MRQLPGPLIQLSRIATGKKLVFLYNGYSLHFPAKKHYNSGMLITEQVMNCPDIDVIVTPAKLLFAQLGTGGTLC